MGTDINDLEKFFRSNDGRLIHKWTHYFDIYDRHFHRFRNKKINILEIGVAHGGSLNMWKDYFGPEAQIYGIDINPECLNFEDEQTRIYIGSQSDPQFLRQVKNRIPKVDILIDDGGHTMRQQKLTFKLLFEHIKDKGVYLCEDVHTSYWIKFGGGHKRRGTFIEFSKNLIDQINAFHSTQRSLQVNSYTKNIGSIHYYDSIVVIEKEARNPPTHERRGQITISNLDKKPFPFAKNRMALRLLTIFNKLLRYLRLPGFIWK